MPALERQASEDGAYHERGDDPGEMGVSLPAVDLGGPALAVVAGGFHTCALLANGSVKCWGANPTGNLGLGDIENRLALACPQ